MVTNQRFQAINFMDGTVEHLAFTMHHDIQVAVEASLIAIEPFYIFQLGVFVELVEETIAEAYGGENCD